MAGHSWGGVDSDDEFDEAAEARFSGKTALLVVIDTCPAMFEGWEENDETPFMAAIKCCESMWRSKVVSNARDLVSILLIGTEKSENSSAFENMFEFQKLSPVTVEMIQQLNEMKNSNDLKSFHDNIGSSENFNLMELFWLAKIIFDEGKTRTFSKKIMYFTCEDNPHGRQPHLQQDAISKFKDLGKVELNVVTFKTDFQFDKFYSNLMEDESAVIYSKNLDSLMKVVRMKQRLRRPVTRSTLQVIPGMKIGVGFYSFVRQAKPPKYVNINRRNNEVIEKNVNVSRKDTGLSILKSEERKMVQVQGEQAVFTPQEIKGIMANETGIIILGYLRMSNLDHFTWFRSPGYFLYPDEERISGSKDLFATLLKRCHALEKIPLVRFVLSRGRSPKLGCLIPLMPDENEEKSVFPQGFYVFPIPFTDEMRKMELETVVEAPPTLLAMMETVVKKLTNKHFDVLEVKNPFLQSKWKKLEEEALGERIEEEEFFDYTEPNEELMGTRLGSLPEKINQATEEVAGTFSEMKSTAPVSKNKATVDVAMEAKHGRLKGCTVAMLKEFLDSRNEEYSRMSKKDDLIVLVNEVLGIE